MVICDKESGWDTSNLDELSEAEAREILNAHWQMEVYEQAQGIKPAIRGFSVHVQDSPDEPKPEWPDRLKKYDTELFPEAYLMDKFDIERPENIGV